MKNTTNIAFIASNESLGNRWQSDRPSDGASDISKRNQDIRTDYTMSNMPKECDNQRYMERYLTWIAWKGQNTVVEDVRIRSWNNALRSTAILFRRRSTNDYKSLLLHTILPIIPLRNWIKELFRIWNGVSRKAAEEITSHIYVPGFWWKVEASECKGIRTLRFIGWKA